MVLRVDVVAAALDAAYRGEPPARVIALAPSGRLLDQPLVEELAAEPHVALLSSRSEGFDQRVLDHLATDAVSIGPYVLSGGELPALVLVDAIARRLPGALAEGSGEHETFSAGLEGGVDWPQYTRPAEFRGWEVPDVLLSGDHGRVQSWRRSRAGPVGSPDRTLLRFRAGRSPGRPLPMSDVIQQLERAQLRDGLPQFKAGDTVRVHFQVIEGQRRRVQVFEGIVIKRQGAGARETFTVRKQSFGVGVERTFPLHSPKIEQIEVASVGDVNRAKLYYLRGKVGKKARVRELRTR